MERVTRNVKSGSIVLFHNNAQHVLEYLPQILQNLQDNGFKVVKINDLIYHENFHIDDQGCQISDGAKEKEKDSESKEESDKNNPVESSESEITGDEKESENE